MGGDRSRNQRSPNGHPTVTQRSHAARRPHGRQPHPEPVQIHSCPAAAPPFAPDGSGGSVRLRASSYFSVASRAKCSRSRPILEPVRPSLTVVANLLWAATFGQRADPTPPPCPQ